MSKEFATADLTGGQLNAIVKKIGGHEAAMEFLRDNKLKVMKPFSWLRRGMSITMTVTSDGATGQDWCDLFAKKDIQLNGDSEALLLSKAFVPTKGVTTKLTILPQPITGIYMKFPDYQKFGEKTTLEAACLLRMALSDADLESLGFDSLAVMHDPVHHHGNYHVLTVPRDGFGEKIGGVATWHGSTIPTIQYGLSGAWGLVFTSK